MQVEEKDILQEIPDEDLPKLSEFYKDVSCAPYIYSFINTAMIWKKKKPNEKYLTFYAPDGNWQDDGTFIAHMQISSYDFLVFTKEESCDKLYNCLVKTKRFEYLKHRILFFAVHRLHISRILEATKALNIPVDITDPCDVWWMPKEKAMNLHVEIPPEVYIKKLSEEDIPIVNELWPHKYEGSEKFLMNLMQMGNSYGLFMKKDNSVAAWIFKNLLGSLAILQTVDQHKRKGYGSILTKYLSKEVAEEGHDPLGTVLVRNSASQKMFTKAGFEILDQVTYVECKKVY